MTTGQAVPYGRTEDFAYGDKGRIEWVIENPQHKTYDICFATAAERPALEPQSYVPLVGVGVAALKMSTDFNKSMANVATLIPGNILIPKPSLSPVTARPF